MSRRELDTKKLFEYLYTHNPSTIIQIAKALNVDPTTARHHLEKLIEKRLVVKQEKRYGTKYYINPELTKIPFNLYIILALTYIPYISAIFLLTLQRYLEASILLAVSSTLGLSQAYLQIYHYKKGRLKELLQLL